MNELLITIQPITAVNWRESLLLKVLPAQQRFVADYSPVALVGLAKAFVRAGGQTWQPLAFYADNQMIGFCTLAFAPERQDNYWLFHFFIDSKSQGQGVGKQAMGALLDYIQQHHAICKCVCLTVHPENVAAQKLYLGVGFQPADTKAFGEPVYTIRLK